MTKSRAGFAGDRKFFCVGIARTHKRNKLQATLALLFKFGARVRASGQTCRAIWESKLRHVSGSPAEALDEDTRGGPHAESEEQ
jgi:hypothetical protein